MPIPKLIPAMIIQRAGLPGKKKTVMKVFQVKSKTG
jgi:hypothetical protein